MTSELVKQLKEAGLNAEDYARGPLGPYTFAASVLRRNPEGLVKVWDAGNKAIEVHGEPKLRQAVVTVDESERVIRRPGRIIHLESWVRVRTYTPNHAQLRNAFGVSMPENTVFGGFGKVTGRSTRKAWRGAITARVPAQKLSFLMGMDETYHFIAMLPSPAKSVQAAHRALRPREAEVRKHPVRQGEWFFIPATLDINTKLNEALAKGNITPTTRMLGNATGAGGTTHMAHEAVNYGGKLYAIGWVRDTRADHHSPVFLGTWHEVVRNREVVTLPTQMVRVARTWD